MESPFSPAPSSKRLPPEVVPGPLVPGSNAAAPIVPEPSLPGARKSGGRRSALAVAAMAVLAKAKTALIVLKGLSFGKVLLTMGSMLVMIAAEATRYGWVYAAGFVALIFIHEMGHAVAIRRAGLDAGLPVFVPFIGAFISLRGQPRSAREEATIALAGPMAGAAASALCAAVYLGTGARLFLALAYGGFFLNLFNMTPVAPLDGGRAAAVFSRKAWWIGVFVLGALFLVTRAPQILLIGVFALMHTRAKGPRLEASPEVRRDVAASFFGLCAFLALGIYLTSRALQAGAF